MQKTIVGLHKFGPKFPLKSIKSVDEPLWRTFASASLWQIGNKGVYGTLDTAN